MENENKSSSKNVEKNESSSKEYRFDENMNESQKRMFYFTFFTNHKGSSVSWENRTRLHLVKVRSHDSLNSIIKVKKKNYTKKSGGFIRPYHPDIDTCPNSFIALLFSV